MTDWYDDADRILLPTYDRIPIHFERGEGVYLFDGQGNKYLDALAGIAVNILGYAHPRIVEVGKKAVEKIQHISNLFQIKPQYQLAKALREQGFPGRPFFCNSGAEAIECALKFSRKYQHRRQRDGRTILSFEGSFHGRTMGALSATGQTKYHQGFQPLPGGFEYLPYNDLSALRRRMADDVCGVIVEPIQGEGGVRPAEPEFLQGLRNLCDEYSSLLIFDEIQTGMGRTGTFYAFQQYGVEPDLVTLAKGIANGYPMGVTMVHESLDDGLLPGDHASTFGGNPFVSRIAETVVRTLEEDSIIEHVQSISSYLLEQLKQLTLDRQGIHEPRGRGLMIGIPLEQSRDASQVMSRAREHGLIVGTAGENVIRLVPPLILTKPEVDELVNKLTRALDD